MMTRVVSRSIRNHLRLVMGAFVLALIVVAICPPSRVESVAAPVFLDAPVVQVTNTTATTISLQWNAPPGTTEYQVERSESMSGPFNRRTIQNGTTYQETVTNLTAYVYRVRAINSSQNPTVISPPSNMVFATAIAFEFTTLATQTIKAQHLHNVRSAVNAVRRLANLPDGNFQPGNLSGFTVQAVHITDLRNKLDEALTALNVPVLAYTDPTLTTGANGTVIKGVHVEQLQARSLKGSSTSAGPLYLNTSAAQGGAFGEVISLPETPVHLSVLPDGRILFWTRDMLRNASNQVKQRTASSDAYLWDMDASQITHVPNSRTNLFCSGHTFLPNGDLFVTGGHRSAHFDAAGEAHTNFFNGSSWSPGPDMNEGRWYPFNVTLNTGEPLIMGGSYWSNEDEMDLDPYNPNDTVPASPPATFADNLIPQVYTPAQTGGLRPMRHRLPRVSRRIRFCTCSLTGKCFRLNRDSTGQTPTS